MVDPDSMPEGGIRETAIDRFRSVAQLNMLHSLAAKLNALGDVSEIGAAITAELRTIIDYHNCRVYLLEEDRESLAPIAFRGDLFTEYEKETLEDLRTRVGEGMTGHVAATGKSLLTPDAREIDFAITIPGTANVLESMLLVPMLISDTVVGVIVLSSLGYGKFDDEDQRLLEVLASHAAVAFENAKLLESARKSAAASTELLRMSQALTRMRSTGDIFQEAIEAAPTLVPCAAIAAYVQDPETGAFRLARLMGIDENLLKPRHEIAEVPAEIAAPFLKTDNDPFTLSGETVAAIPDEYSFVNEARAVLVAPLRWEPDGLGALLLIASTPSSSFDDEDLRLARGIADITSLALGNARRLSELERFHELVESLDAVFWEADARTRTFSFIAGRSDELLGPGATDWPSEGRVWGDHILPDDRREALEQSRAAAEAG